MPLTRKARDRMGSKQWPFPELRWIGHRWVEPDMEDVFTAYSQRYDAVLKPAQS
jgi:hypothetical protein